MAWDKNELEKLYMELNQKAAVDKELRKLAMSDPKAALEKLAGKPLPDDFTLKVIQNDSGFAATYMMPNFAQGDLNFQELNDDEIDAVSGGVSIFLIVSVCGAAASVAGCGADACGANACGGNACGANACGADACAGNVCGGNADAGGGCAGAVCGGDACGGNVGCAGYISHQDVCGGFVGCEGYVS